MGGPMFCFSPTINLFIWSCQWHEEVQEVPGPAIQWSHSSNLHHYSEVNNHSLQ